MFEINIMNKININYSLRVLDYLYQSVYLAISTDNSTIKLNSRLQFQFKAVSTFKNSLCNYFRLIQLR